MMEPTIYKHGGITLDSRCSYVCPHVAITPDLKAMAKHVDDWLHEPEGETTVDELVAELWRIGADDGE